MNQMETKDNFVIPKSIGSFKDNTSISHGQVKEWSRANIVWNIYDSSKLGYIYQGKIKNTDAVTGSILAPGATITLEHNLNGTVIGKEIIVNGETHRDDYVSPKQPEVPEQPEEPKKLPATGYNSYPESIFKILGFIFTLSGFSIIKRKKK